MLAVLLCVGLGWKFGSTICESLDANEFVGGNVWLKQWAELNSEKGKNPDVGKYIGIYFAFGIGGAALVVVQTLILWIFCSIEVNFSVAIAMHHNMRSS